jgi:tetratricopeptide (TPR) repeat protein
MVSVAPQTENLHSVLQQAMAHHQAGRLLDAERLYRQVLRAHPTHPGVNNALGIALKGRAGRRRRSRRSGERLRLRLIMPQGHSNLGNILFEQGKFAETEGCYRWAVALRPEMADALKNLGLVLVDSRFEESFPFFRRHRAFAILAREGACSLAVPHRANRAVIFDSDLFHERDRIAFKEGYLNRRINITMLYGNREKRGKHPS